jgi:hypothetical protein
MDPWNIVGRLKGTLDGIVDSGILSDDKNIDPPKIHRMTDKKNQRVTIEIKYKE